MIIQLKTNIPPLTTNKYAHNIGSFIQRVSLNQNIWFTFASMLKKDGVVSLKICFSRRKRKITFMKTTLSLLQFDVKLQNNYCIIIIKVPQTDL